MAAHEAFIALESQLPPSSTIDSLRGTLQTAIDRLTFEYERELGNLKARAADFLFNLDDRKHDEETVKGVIEAFPNALKHVESEYNYTPVQYLFPAESHYGYSFVPLLVEEGIRRKVFTEEEKGGLNFIDKSEYVDFIDDYLNADESDRVICDNLGIAYHWEGYNSRIENDIEFKSLVADTMAKCDEKRKNVLQRLFDLKVFEKKEIIECNMIYSCSKDDHSERRLEYLLSICPESLAKPDGMMNSLPIEQHTDSLCNNRGFEIILKAGLKYYPKELGFLFYKGPTKHKRIIEIAMDVRLGYLTQEKLCTWMHEAIPPSNDQPILHDVIRLAPKFFSLFWRYYPDAIYLRDQKGRLPLHIALQRSAIWSPLLLSLIAVNDPIDRHEKDPVTGLYPFMSAASGRVHDLNVIYYLLRRDPNAWEGFRLSPP